jgi:response regulator RpfG family c-di-GMP phosphodiesterase
MFNENLKINNNLPPVETKKSQDSEMVGINMYKKLHKMNEGNLDMDFAVEMKEHEELFSDTFELTENDLEILMVMYRFNKGTFRHSIRTLSIVKNKINKPLEKNIVLAEWIGKEIQDMDVFYRACLFHDIGKIAIPEFILTNKLNDIQWANYLFELTPSETNNSIIKD